MASDLKPYIARVTILGNISRRPTGSPSFDALGNRPRYFSSAAATMLGRTRLRPEISGSSVRYVPRRCENYFRKINMVNLFLIFTSLDLKVGNCIQIYDDFNLLVGNIF